MRMKISFIYIEYRWGEITIQNMNALESTTNKGGTSYIGGGGGGIGWGGERTKAVRNRVYLKAVADKFSLNRGIFFTRNKN